ncbi:MAG: hypothetical protein ACW97X_13845, partial [Candidatus Hodarchaeales archaeon]
MPLEKRLSKLIILIVGKSGSGKDTLMRESQKILQSQKSVPVNILQRVITRKSDKNEESIYLTEDEFIERKKENIFAFSWKIYGNWYGCPIEAIESALKKGELILINVSRGVLHEARKYYPHCNIIHIDVPQSI